MQNDINSIENNGNYIENDIYNAEKTLEKNDITIIGIHETDAFLQFKSIRTIFVGSVIDYFEWICS